MTGCHGLCQGALSWSSTRRASSTRASSRAMSPTSSRRAWWATASSSGCCTGSRRPAPPIALEKDVPFYAQMRVVRGHQRLHRPASIDDYLARGGYAALASVLDDGDPEAVIDEVERERPARSRRRRLPDRQEVALLPRQPGREAVRHLQRRRGRPGRLHGPRRPRGQPPLGDRGHDHRRLRHRSGTVPSRATSTCAMSTRSPWSACASRWQQARERGLLGDDILGSGFDFDIRINQGAGAFVCGESTALTASIEGRRGMPRGKHIRTVAHGLCGQPTNLNNVETLRHRPLDHHPWRRRVRGHGHGDPKGTKIFSLTGKVRNSGLVEVPMGATLRHVIFDIGGGMLPGREFKAVQLGGPSGGCVPAEYSTRRSTSRASRRGLDDGLRRHGRGRRHHLHGRFRQVLPQVHGRGVLRQVRTVPRGHAAHARDPRAHQRPARARWTTSTCWSDSPTTSSRARSASSAAAPPTPSSRPSATSATNTWPTCSTSAARRRSAGRSSATPSTRRSAPAASRATSPAPPRPSAASANRSRRSARGSASSAIPAVRSATSMPSTSSHRASYRRGRREDSMSTRTKATTVKLTIDGRPSAQARRDRARGGTARRHRHPRPLPPGGHGALGRLPPLPDRGRGLGQAAGRLHDLGAGRPRRAHRQRARARAAGELPAHVPL